MSSGAKLFYLKVGRKSIATLSALEKTECFSWTPEAEEALDNLKKMLTSAPVLVPPQPAEPLLLYVASTTQVVSAAVVVERQEEDMRCRSRGRSTLSARYSQRPTHDIRRSRN